MSGSRALIFCRPPTSQPHKSASLWHHLLFVFLLVPFCSYLPLPCLIPFCFIPKPCIFTVTSGQLMARPSSTSSLSQFVCPVATLHLSVVPSSSASVLCLLSHCNKSLCYGFVAVPSASFFHGFWSHSLSAAHTWS